MFFSPISEMPRLGRNIPYFTSFFLFILMTAGAATVDNFAGFIVLRFLQGLVGGPVLATGGASAGDLYSMLKVPYAMAAWTAGAFAGPSLGPLMARLCGREVDLALAAVRDAHCFRLYICPVGVLSSGDERRYHTTLSGAAAAQDNWQHETTVRIGDSTGPDARPPDHRPVPDDSVQGDPAGPMRCLHQRLHRADLRNLRKFQ